MSIELQTFQRIRTKIQAVRYTGPRMDLDLMDSKYKHDFRFAYDYQGNRKTKMVTRGAETATTIYVDQYSNAGHTYMMIGGEKITVC